MFRGLRRLSFRYLNARPGPDWHELVDRSGKRYWGLWAPENIRALEVYRYGRQVGYVNLLLEGQRCTLADIYIRNHSDRKIGLGKAMLQFVIEQLRHMNVIEVRGGIGPGSDGEPIKYLRAWYRRQGFLVDGTRLYLALDAQERSTARR